MQGVGLDESVGANRVGQDRRGEVGGGGEVFLPREEVVSEESSTSTVE